MTENFQAIILHKSDFQEFDQIIKILTKEKGILTVFCPGVQKITSKNKYNLHLFSVSYFELFLARSQGKISRLKRATSELIFESVYQDSEILLVALYFNQLFLTIFDVAQLYDYNFYFDLLITILSKLNDKKNLKKIFCFYTYFLLPILGIAWNLNNCNRCQKNENIITFNFEESSFICQNCIKSTEKLLKLSLSKSIFHLSKLNFSDLEEWKIEDNDLYYLVKIMIYILKEKAGISLKSLNQLQEKWAWDIKF